MKSIVAIFPAGSEIGLEIHNSLKYSTFCEVLGLSSGESHADYVYKRIINDLPNIKTDSFLEKLNFIIEENKIDFIYPALDDVQLFLMENSKHIKANIISSDLFTVSICRSKKKTYQFFQNHSFIPTVYEDSNSIEKYPVFIKPDIGQGSQGAMLIKSKEELVFQKRNNENIVICEYLEGEEYTIDCFSIDKILMDINIRNRRRIRNGISVSSEILEKNENVLKIAEIINDALNFKGAWFFQIKKDKNNKFKLLEIAPRIAGTMGLTRNTGSNYALMTVHIFAGNKIRLLKNNYNIRVDRALTSRFFLDYDYNNVYVDLDDTIIIKNCINSFLMMFLYQCKNKNKRIILITKHEINPLDTLKKYYISADLFNSIIWLNKEQDKKDFINSKKSIFIDDSFSERISVLTALSIPVFDCSEVESLMDWRM